MATGGSERTGMLEHPLADKFRGVIAEFGGSDEVAEELLSRFNRLEEEPDGKIAAEIHREADPEGVSDSWVRMEFNPYRRTVLTTISVAGLVRRELAKDLLDGVTAVHLRDEDAVVFVNEAGRMLWLNKDNKVVTTPF